MSINDSLTWLQQLPLAVTIAESNWLYPILEATHVLAIGIVFGSIAMVDLRLLGLAWRERSIDDLTATVLPWTWVAFALAVLTGSLMFISKADVFFHNLPLRLKFACIALAGINMLVFHGVTHPRLASAACGPALPRAARAAGGISLSLWIGVVCAGRWIGFTL